MSRSLQQIRPSGTKLKLVKPSKEVLRQRNFNPWVSFATPQARNIVRAVFRSKPNVAGLSSQDIYGLAHKLFPDANGPRAPPAAPVFPKSKNWQAPPEPPMKGHPIRSMKYLKKIVLESMAEGGEVEKIHIRRDRSGQDGEGDTVKIKAKGKAPATVSVDFQLPAKEAWLWRLAPEEPKVPVEEGKVRQTIISQVPVDIQFEDESSHDELELLPDDWNKKLRFVDVGDLDSVLAQRERQGSGGREGQTSQAKGRHS